MGLHYTEAVVPTIIMNMSDGSHTRRVHARIRSCNGRWLLAPWGFYRLTAKNSEPHGDDSRLTEPAWQSRRAPRAALNLDTLLVPNKLNPATPPQKTPKLSWLFFLQHSTIKSQLYLSGAFPAVWPNDFKPPWATFQSKVSQSSKRNQTTFLGCHRRNSNFQSDHVVIWFKQLDDWGCSSDVRFIAYKKKKGCLFYKRLFSTFSVKLRSSHLLIYFKRQWSFNHDSAIFGQNKKTMLFSRT